MALLINLFSLFTRVNVQATSLWLLDLKTLNDEDDKNYYYHHNHNNNNNNVANSVDVAIPNNHNLHSRSPRKCTSKQT